MLSAAQIVIAWSVITLSGFVLSVGVFWRMYNILHKKQDEAYQLFKADPELLDHFKGFVEQRTEFWRLTFGFFYLGLGTSIGFLILWLAIAGYRNLNFWLYLISLYSLAHGSYLLLRTKWTEEKIDKIFKLQG